MGKTFKKNSDESEFFKAQRLQREQQQRRKKQRGKEEFDQEQTQDTTPKYHKKAH